MFVTVLSTLGPWPSNSLTSLSPPGVPHWPLGFQHTSSVQLVFVNPLHFISSSSFVIATSLECHCCCLQVFDCLGGQSIQQPIHLTPKLSGVKPLWLAGGGWRKICLITSHLDPASWCQTVLQVLKPSKPKTKQPQIHHQTLWIQLGCTRLDRVALRTWVVGSRLPGSGQWL